MKEMGEDDQGKSKKRKLDSEHYVVTGGDSQLPSVSVNSVFLYGTPSPYCCVLISVLDHVYVDGRAQEGVIGVHRYNSHHSDLYPGITSFLAFLVLNFF